MSRSTSEARRQTENRNAENVCVCLVGDLIVAFELTDNCGVGNIELAGEIAGWKSESRGGVSTTDYMKPRLGKVVQLGSAVMLMYVCR